MAIEDRFDRVGSHVIRYAYSAALDHPQNVIELWTLHASPMQKRIVRASFPLLKRAFAAKLKLDTASVAKSERKIGEALDWLADQLSDGRRYLVGGKLSVADITAAALLAPIACPHEHPVYYRPAFRDGIVPLRAKWESHPGMIWVQEIYRAHRHELPPK